MWVHLGYFRVARREKRVTVEIKVKSKTLWQYPDVYVFYKMSILAYLSYRNDRTALIGQNTVEGTHFPQFCGGMWVLASQSDQREGSLTERQQKHDNTTEHWSMRIQIYVKSVDRSGKSSSSSLEDCMKSSMAPFSP